MKPWLSGLDAAEGRAGTRIAGTRAVLRTGATGAEEGREVGRVQGSDVLEVASRARTGSRQLAALVEIEPFGEPYSASSRTFSPLAYLCAAALVIGFIAGMATGENLPRSVGRGNAALAPPSLAERVAAPSSETPSAGRVVGAVDTPFDVRLDLDTGAPRPNTPIVNAYTGFVTGSGVAP